jgi:hypothetical protein
MPNQRSQRVLLILSKKEHHQAQMVRFSLWLSQKLGESLLITVPDLLSWPESQWIHQWRSSVRGSPLDLLDQSPFLEVRSLGQDSYLKKVLHLIRDEKINLIVMDKLQIVSSLQEARHRAKNIDLQEFMAHLTSPLLLFDSGQSSPEFQSILVPMSGEVKQSQALEWAISFANQMQLPLDLIHVTRSPVVRVMESSSSLDSSLIGRTCDDFHHEYPSLVSEFLIQASPYSSVREKSVIREFVHCTGSELQEIIQYGQHKTNPIVVIEWKGNLSHGRSHILKGILQQTPWMTVLMREKGSLRSR